jgi:hypothetical protein
MSLEQGAPRIRFLTRAGCHLCVEARRVVEQVAREEGGALEIVDVDSQAELAERYGEEVPVLLIDGLKAFKFRVDEDALRRRLRRARPGTP